MSLHHSIYSKVSTFQDYHDHDYGNECRWNLSNCRGGEDWMLDRLVEILDLPIDFSKDSLRWVVRTFRMFWDSAISMVEIPLRTLFGATDMSIGILRDLFSRKVAQPTAIGRLT